MFRRHPNLILLHWMENMWPLVGGCCHILSLFSVCQLIGKHWVAPRWIPPSQGAASLATTKTGDQIVIGIRLEKRNKEPGCDHLITRAPYGPMEALLLFGRTSVIEFGTAPPFSFELSTTSYK